MNTVPVTQAKDSGAHRDNDTDILHAALGELPIASGRPTLVILSGLPGSGKSYFCRQLAVLLPSLVVVESDALRRVLFPEPQHTPPEHARVFRNIHILLESLLEEGHTVAFDATNLVRRHRKRLYDIVERTNAEMLIVRLTAPERIIRQRLARRMSRVEKGWRTKDKSTAGIDVYLQLRRTSRPIRRDHITVDTSQDITPAVEQIADELRPSIKSGTPNPL